MRSSEENEQYHPSQHRIYLRSIQQPQLVCDGDVHTVFTRVFANLNAFSVYHAVLLSQRSSP